MNKGGPTMIEFYQLEQLRTIAKEGTLSKAAETLLLSQPALTRSVQRLEEDLGLKLFDRKKNKIILNDNGKLAIELIEKILQERDQMIQTLQSYDRSKFVIGIGSCAPIPIQALKHVLKKEYPQMQITDVLDSNETRLLEGLKNHEFSIIVLNHPIEDDRYTCIELFKENLYLSVPPAHPLALFNEISFEDLNGESVLLLSSIGFWNEICVKMIPQSHLLIQEDYTVFEELTKASALPNFKSNITLLTDHSDGNRIAIAIKDKEAHANYFAIYHKDNQKLFNEIKDQFVNIDWKTILLT